MNWKFWIRPLDQVAQSWCDKFRAEVEANNRLREALAFREDLQLDPPTAQRIAAALVAVDEENPQWRAVHALLDIMERDEITNAMVPGLSNEARHFQAGRAGCLADVRAMLLQQWTKARASNRASQ